MAGKPLAPILQPSSSFDDEYAELLRQAEEISELRDEALCVQRLAELNDQLPEARGTTTQARD